MPGRYVLAVLRDVNERKALDAQRLADARLGGALLVARTVAHEINNALAPVAGFAELLSLRPAVAGDPQAAAYVRLIAEAAAEIADRARRLQAIVRLDENASVLGPDRPILDLNRSASPPSQ